MFNRISQNSMNTPLAEGIPMGKSPLVRGDYFKFFYYSNSGYYLLSPGI